MARLPFILLRAASALTLTSLFCLASAADGESQGCADEGLAFGFYAFFDPVSYSADNDPESEGFNRHLGYEADLLSGLEAMEGAGLSFARHAIPLWDDIWLGSATPRYDVVGGGITILDSRRQDATGAERVAFTSGHIAFRQSLLTRANDAGRFDRYDKLTDDARVGVLASTTGESRLLELTGYVDENGVLASGVKIDTPQGELVADGSDKYVISPAVESTILVERVGLRPPVETMPQVIYLGAEQGESELIQALGDGEIDAIARGQLGNIAAAHASDGAFVLSVVDDKIEYGGFTVDINAEDLAVCLDAHINWLTDEGRIGFGEWLAEPAIFMRRAQMWNEREAQED